MRRGLFQAVALAAALSAIPGGLLLAPGPQRSLAAPADLAGEADRPPIDSSQTYSYSVYLPIVSRPPDACAPIPDVQYTYLGVVERRDPAKPPPANNPDYNLLLLGYDLTDGYRGLVWYDGPTDDKAPQMRFLFNDLRIPVFRNLYRAHGWDWERHIPLPPPEPNPPYSWPVTVAGLEVQPLEILYTPESGYDIQYGYDAMVLYATREQITLTYTRNDHIGVGYTVYVTGICVEPSLLALYEALDAAGRYDLPVLRGQQPLGRAWGTEITVGIRDNACFGDPRSCKDHWKGYCP